MSALSSRLKALTRLQCEIFQTSYNPQNLRTGAKYLRKHLRGPAMVKYYPEVVNVAAIAREFPKMGLVDPKEAQRLADVEDRKRRGKGAPKKAKNKEDSRRTAKRR
ncbi:Mitochondrial 37S ribosomal protein S27 [Mycena sanguinolenta]|uniref:Small ribosomal subunit protein mS33 n=1 Tax=Mycena sanguinolenta TaxID=230812 RepID=A0A8H7DF75_9AGAR|nr:Mitochondrial 37S ribosomal protein S27 [Mycena sanguinolenta]